MTYGRVSTFNEEIEDQLLGWFNHERYNLFSNVPVRKIVEKEN
jgi:hypothetical protein